MTMDWKTDIRLKLIHEDEALKDFVITEMEKHTATTLSTLREKIEGMKKHHLYSPRSFGDGEVVDVASGYNQSCDDILKLIKEMEGQYER